MKKGIKIVLIMVSLLIVVFLALVSINLFSVPGAIGVNCTAKSNFYCTELFYSHHTGNLTIIVRQNTGQTWTGWAIGYAPNETYALVGMPTVNFVTVPNSTPFYSGHSIKIPSGILFASQPETIVGTSTVGGLWVCYTKSKGVTNILGGNSICIPQGNSSAIVEYTEIATLSAKAG